MDEADRCPYPRPFPETFEDCPAFQPIRFEPVDTGRRPLHAAWTCRHLAPASSELGAFYPRCRLGDAAARQDWADALGGRNQRLRDLRRRLVAGCTAELEEFLGLQRRAVDQPDLYLAVRQAADRLIAALDRTLDKNRELVDAVGLPLETGRAILHDMIAGWVASGVPVVSLEAPPQLIARYPEAKELLAPEADPRSD